jgi:hypothetical protein
VYRILVRADDGGALAEVDETDNVRATGPINVVRPDLRISALSPPAAVVAGRRVSVPHTVRNDSAAPGAAGPFGVELYLSADGTITPGADVLLAARTLAGLAPLAASAATPTVTIPDTPGELFLGAIADPAGAVTEDEENDNVLVAPIAIVPEMLRTTPASTFNSTMDAVVTGCAFTPNHSLDDQPSALRITAQSATTPTRWSGTLQFLDPFADPLGPVSVSIAMSGTVATTGAISGTFTIAAGTARGSGTFTGSATSSAGGAGTFTATFDGGFTFPAFCTISGTATQP